MVSCLQYETAIIYNNTLQNSTQYSKISSCSKISVKTNLYCSLFEEKCVPSCQLLIHCPLSFAVQVFFRYFHGVPETAVSFRSLFMLVPCIHSPHQVYSSLVARRHYRLSHGVGRSGDVAEAQPKAAGSSLLAKLCHTLAGDALRLAGLGNSRASLVLPMATG